jgi:hypothetical protein
MKASNARREAIKAEIISIEQEQRELVDQPMIATPPPGITGTNQTPRAKWQRNPQTGKIELVR